MNSIAKAVYDFPVPLLVTVFLFCSFPSAKGSEIEPIKIDLRDNYFVGEALQVGLILPEKIGSAVLLLRGPDGSVEPLLPNTYETFSYEGEHPRKRLFPDPSLGYQAVVKAPGEYRLVTVNIEELPRDPEWPKVSPPDFAGVMRVINEAIRATGSLAEPALSTLTFTVKPGTRPAEETLPLADGILDGMENPVFAPGSTRLSTSGDYREIWRWARLMNSPAHRHQSFLIECHAREGESRKENLDLSQQRADAVVAYLVNECHVPVERLTATGKGDFEPLRGIELDDPRQNRVTLVLDNAAGARILR